jgi:4'-phosphopantetheinyl transferase
MVCAFCGSGCNKKVTVSPDISRWQAAPINPQLDHNELHLWRFRTDSSAATVSSLQQSLAEDEIARAARFLSPTKQQQFIVSRGYLRLILGCYLQCPPAAVAFDYTDQGRPFLTEEDKTLDFNLSHSGVWGVIAISRSTVGVDVELIRVKQNLQSLAEYAFDADEFRSFVSYVPTRQQRGFYRIWTAKEARYKCPGKGYYLRSFPLARDYIVTVVSHYSQPRVIRFHLCNLNLLTNKPTQNPCS